MNKKHGTIDRETAIKQLIAAGSIGAALPLLMASADAKTKHRSGGVGGSPMNLTYTVPGSMTSARTKGTLQGTLTIQMWDSSISPPPAAPGTLQFSFDGSAITPKGDFDDHCHFDGKAKNGALHVRVYFLQA